VIPIDNLEHATDVANGVPYGLSASIYTRNVNRAFQATRDLYTGIVYVNAPTIGAETHLPFGGTKQTGNGHREAAIRRHRFFHRVENRVQSIISTCSSARKSITISLSSNQRTDERFVVTPWTMARFGLGAGQILPLPFFRPTWAGTHVDRA